MVNMQSLDLKGEICVTNTVACAAHAMYSSSLPMKILPGFCG